MEAKLRFLYLEDDLRDRQLVAAALADAGLVCNFTYAKTQAEYARALGQGEFDLIFADFTLPSFDGTKALAIARKTCPEVPFVFVSGTIGEERAIESLKSGATDYVLKNRLERLAPVVRRALEERDMLRARQATEQKLRASEERYRLLFNSGYDAVLVHEGPDAQGRPGKFIEVNNIACQRLGYTRAELLQMSPFDLDSPESAQAIPEMARRLAKEKHATWETVNVTKDGRRFPVEISSQLFELNGKPAYLSTIRDITERKQTEAELRRANAKLNQVLDHTPAVIYTLKIEGSKLIPVFVSENIQRLLGFSVAESMSHEWWLGRLHPEDREHISASIIRELAGDGYSMEYRLRHKDGTYRWVQDDNHVVRDAAGQAMEAVGVWTDITVRKASEEALCQSEAELAEARRLAKYGNWSWDIASDKVTWSTELYQLFGVEKTSFQHTYDSFFERVDPADQEAVRQISRKACTEGKPFEIVYGITTPAGEKRVIRELGYAVRDEAGKVARLVGTAQDITLQAQVEAELRWKTAFLEAQVDSSLDGIMVVNGEGKKILQNQRLNQLWKLPLHIASAVDDREQARFIMQQMRNPQAFIERMEYLYAHPDEVSRDEIELLDGRILDRYSAPVVGKDGVNYGRIRTYRDITEQRRLETQLRQAQKMEAIGQLAGGVAHDFNNMLAVIRGNADLLLMGGDQLGTETSLGLKQIIAAAERAAKLTRQLLMFSRKQVMQPQPLALDGLVQDLLKMLQRIIREDIRLECVCQNESSLVEADAGMIEQVLLNLVVNARDAMPHGGLVRIATEKVALAEEAARRKPEARAGDFVCLSVSDNGTGIAPEHLQRIFEPFFTTKEVGKGTGLGLATVYGIVKQHQGWIEVSSQVGQGTTFRVFVPAIPPSAAAGAAQAMAPKLRGGTETILLVEDDASVRLVTRRVLESYGYTVCEASCGREALETWGRQAGEIMLLLSDIVMPEGLTGRDLAQQMRAEKPGLRVILMSGYSAEVMGKGTEFLRRTKTYFLQKPCPSSTLLQTVRQCLDEK